MPKVMPFARNWCFTLNVQDELASSEPRWDSSSMVYLCFQQERAPSTGQLHYQGLVSLKRPARMSRVKELLPGAHLEVCRDFFAAIDYCFKSDTRVPGTEPVEYGDWSKGVPHQGRRSDLIEVAALVDRGASRSDIAYEYPSVVIRYGAGVERLARWQGSSAPLSTLRDRSRSVEVTVYYGPTGTGKTRAVYDAHPILYAKPPEHKWWDGYSGQDVVLVDDFDGRTGKDGMWITYWLRVCDRYPIMVETKGGQVNLLATKFYFTSNKHPHEWWPSSVIQAHKDAFNRRITCIQHMGPPSPPRPSDDSWASVGDSGYEE